MEEKWKLVADACSEVLSGMFSEWKQIPERFHALAIGRKLLLLSLIVSIGPIVMILMINYQLSERVVKRQVDELIHANLTQNAVNIEKFCFGCEQLMKGIYTDDFFAERLKPINRWDDRLRYKAEYEIEQKLRDVCYNNSAIMGLAIVGIHHDICFYDTLTQSGETTTLFNMNQMDKDYVMEQARADRGWIYSPPVRIEDKEHGFYNCIYVLHQLTDFSAYHKGPVGCIVLCFDESTIRDIYSSGITKTSITVVVDKRGNMISSPARGWQPAKAEDLKTELVEQEAIDRDVMAYVQGNSLIGGIHPNVMSVPVMNGAFYVVNVQDYDYAALDFTYIFIITGLVGVLAILICIGFAQRTTVNVNDSLGAILHAMDGNREGDSQRVEETNIDGEEFVQIARHFNRMIKSIQDLQLVEREALMRQNDAEIKALEAQINPHFLYNTLDAINWLAIDRSEYGISRMCTSLAAILRYSIQNSNEIVELDSELEYLKKYVHLQQQRLNYSFLCTMKVDDDLKDIRIHKMLLQPLLENTLVHGFPGKSEINEIRISFRKLSKDRVRILIRDNGKGMSREMVKYFNQYDHERDSIGSNIGLRNVITRLKLYYGGKGSFYMRSDRNGTEITMDIPYETAPKKRDRTDTKGKDAAPPQPEPASPDSASQSTETQPETAAPEPTAQPSQTAQDKAETQPEIAPRSDGDVRPEERN